MSSLEQLDLSDNNRNGEDFHLINLAFKNLRTLILCNNSIRNSDNVALMSKCIHLSKLNMSANPVTETQSYRDNVFEKLNNLEALDGYSKDGEEWSFSDMTELGQNDDELSEEEQEDCDDDDEEEGEEEKEEKEEEEDDFKEPKINVQEIEESKDEIIRKEDLQ